MQGAIEPRLIQRYEPHPLPAPAPAGEGAAPAAKSVPAKKEPVTSPKGGKDE
jgi:hypothetical protein